MPGILSNQRVVVGELMDLPDIDETEHRNALAGLGRINRVSHVSRRMARPILELAANDNLKQLSLLDVACGGGDVPVGVVKRLQRDGIDIHLTFLDRSETALSQATLSAKQAGVSCNAVRSDALVESGVDPVDVVTNSLFLHHINTVADVVDFLRSLRRLARRMVVISDLRRSPTAFVAAWIGCRLLSRSPIVHFDGPTSVRAAWTLNELRGFALEAGLEGAMVRRCSPWRMLLIWKRPPGTVEPGTAEDELNR